MIEKYTGIPNVMLNGKVTARDISKNIPGFALGAAIFIATGTAI